MKTGKATCRRRCERGRAKGSGLFIVALVAVRQQEDCGDDCERKEDNHQPARAVTPVKSECQHCVHDAFFL
jgi:hypothetical protein